MYTYIRITHIIHILSSRVFCFGLQGQNSCWSGSSSILTLCICGQTEVMWKVEVDQCHLFWWVLMALRHIEDVFRSDCSDHIQRWSGPQQCVHVCVLGHIKHLKLLNWHPHGYMEGWGRSEQMLIFAFFVILRFCCKNSWNSNGRTSVTEAWY